MRYLYIISFIFGIILSSFSQTGKTDSLVNLLTKVSDKEKVKVLNELSEAWLPDSIEISLKYCKQALNLALKIKNKKGEINALKCFGNIYREKSEYDSSLIWYNKALKKAEQINNNKNIADINKKISITYYKKTYFDKALNYSVKALNIYKKIKNSEGVGDMYNNIGLIYLHLEQNKKAMDYFSKSLKIYNEINNKKKKAMVLNNLGLIYYENNNLIKALEYYKQSIYIKEEINEKKGKISTLNNIGDIFFLEEKYDSALVFFFKALKLCKEENKWSISKISINIGKTYTELGNYSSALKYLKEAKDIAYEINVKGLIAGSYEGLYKLNYTLKNFKTAYNYLELYKNYIDTIFNEDMSSKIAELEVKYETEKKEQQILLLSKQNILEKANARKQKFLKYLFLIILLFILLTALLLYQNIRQKNKLNVKIKSEQKILQTLMDTNPNPLYYKDKEGKYIGCNKGFEKIIGLSKNEIFGKTVKDIPIIHTTYDHEKVDNELLKTGKIKKYQTTISFSDNIKHEFEIIKTIYKNPDSSVAGILCIMVDITHLKKQEKKIREQQKEIHEKEKEKLQAEIKFKKKELADMSVQLIQNNQYINKFIQDITSLSVFSNKEGNNFIKRLVSEYKIIIKEENWDNFENNFKINHPEFSKKIQNNFPELTKNDKKICTMLYLDFSTKEIADAAFKSIRTIESTRLRIRKKLNILGTDEDLCRFLKKL